MIEWLRSWGLDLRCGLFGHVWMSTYIGSVPEGAWYDGKFLLLPTNRDFYANRCIRCERVTGPMDSALGPIEVRLT